MSLRATLLATVTVLGFASAASGETLPDAIALAYDSNPGIQAQRAALRAVNENEVQALAGYGPTVQAQITESANRLVRPAPQQSSSTTSTSFDFSQPLYTGGRVNAAV